MKKIFFTAFILSGTFLLSAQTGENPFKKHGFKKVQTYTSSKGEFAEFHDNKDVVEIGSVLFDTKTNQVVGYANEEPENEVVATTPAMSMDPLCEKYYWISPYAYCKNNPVNRIDPDGRDDYYTNEGRFLYRDKKKTDEIRIVNNYAEQVSKQSSGKSSGKVDMGKLESVSIGAADLSAEAYSNIFTDVLSKMEDVNMNELVNGKVSAAVFDGNDADLSLKEKSNTNIREYNETASHQGVNGKSLVTANVVVGSEKDNRSLYSTVSNVQNMLGAHEFLGHGMNNWGDRSKTHYKVYEFQMAHPSWPTTTPQFKTRMNTLYQRYLNPKR